MCMLTELKKKILSIHYHLAWTGIFVLHSLKKILERGSRLGLLSVRISYNKEKYVKHTFLEN